MDTIVKPLTRGKKSLQVEFRKMEMKIWQITLQDHTRKSDIRKRLQIKDVSPAAYYVK